MGRAKTYKTFFEQFLFGTLSFGILRGFYKTKNFKENWKKIYFQKNSHDLWDWSNKNYFYGTGPFLKQPVTGQIITFTQT